MRNAIMSLTATVLLSFGPSNQSNATLLNFDDLVGGIFLTDQFKSEGIIFDGAWVQIGLSPSRGSAPNWISGELVTNNGLNPNAISGRFVNPTNSSKNATTNFFSGLSVFADSDTIVILKVFDLSGILLASTSRIDDGTLSTSVSGIHKFTFSHINTGFNGIDDIFGFDNIEFGAVVATIPEPAALILLISGIAGMGLMGWKRKTSS